MRQVIPRFKVPRVPRRRTRPSGWCEAQIPTVCLGKAVHVHHVVLRSQGGQDGPTKNVCAFCHNWIHRNPVKAREKGLLQ